MHRLRWLLTPSKAIAAWEVCSIALRTPTLVFAAYSKAHALIQFCEAACLASAIFYARRMAPENLQRLILQMSLTANATEGGAPHYPCPVVPQKRRNSRNRTRSIFSMLCRSSSTLLALLPRLACTSPHLGLVALFKATNLRALICSNILRPDFEVPPCPPLRHAK